MPTYECPTCRTPFSVESHTDAPFRPFCCQRCRMVDLGRWLDGTYTITEPAEPGDFDDADEFGSGAE